MTQTTATISTVQLPADLAPSLTERLLRLLNEVTLTRAPDLEFAAPSDRHRCVVCHRSGKLGGHHGADGRIQWVHAKCHRRLHRSGRHDVVVPAQRRSRYACCPHHLATPPRRTARCPGGASLPSPTPLERPCTCPPSSTATWSPSSRPTS